MTVVPLFCARFIHHASRHDRTRTGRRPAARFQPAVQRSVRAVSRQCTTALLTRVLASARCSRCRCLAWRCVASLAMYPRLGLSFFPRTDAGQFVINVKAPSGTRLE